MFNTEMLHHDHVMSYDYRKQTADLVVVQQTNTDFLHRQDVFERKLSGRKKNLHSI